MALIRSKQAAALVREAVVLDLGDLARQGEAIKKRAEAQADQILQKAREEARQLSQTASKQGHEQGHKAGLAQGHKEGLEAGRQEAFAKHAAALDALQKQWLEALNGFVEARQSLLAEARLDVLRLALAIAERVVFRTVEIDPTVIEDQMAEALGMLAKRSAVTIRVNPAELEQARTTLPELVSRMHQCEDASVLADESLTPGGCVLQAGMTTIDASIETQLDRIVATLLPDDPGLTAAAEPPPADAPDSESTS